MAQFIITYCAYKSIYITLIYVLCILYIQYIEMFIHVCMCNVLLTCMCLLYGNSDFLKDPAQCRREKFKQTKTKEAEVHTLYYMSHTLYHMSHTLYHIYIKRLILYITCLILYIKCLILYITCLILYVTCLILYVTCLILCITSILHVSYSISHVSYSISRVSYSISHVSYSILNVSYSIYIRILSSWYVCTVTMTRTSLSGHS